MNIMVPLKQVPDLVEELEVDDSGTDLNREWLKYKINEFDDHALEEALLLKEETGATVTVIALESEDIDKTLFTAIAKGADKAIKITGDFGNSIPSLQTAKALAHVLQSLDYHLILTGVQAADDRDGQTAVILAQLLGVPHASVVTGVSLSGSNATILKEYSGGIMGEFEVDLPVVLGIQAARQTPRYAPVSRVRQAMKSGGLEEMEAGDASHEVGSQIKRIFKPESGQGAEMLAGDADEIADKIIGILKEKGVRS